MADLHLVVPDLFHCFPAAPPCRRCGKPPRPAYGEGWLQVCGDGSGRQVLWNRCQCFCECAGGRS